MNPNSSETTHAPDSEARCYREAAVPNPATSPRISARTFLLVAILLCAVFFRSANAQSSVEIADGRHASDWLDLSAYMTRPPMQQASEAARAYWVKQDPEYEEEVRVLATADGAFTRPDTEQQAVLYVMSLWPRCCPKMGLAILEGERLVRNVAFEGVAQELVAVPDLDGDGRSELFYTGSFGMGGQESVTLTFLRFEADGLTEVGSTPISDNTCATGSEESMSTAARVLALPGPTFMVEHYLQASCEEESWQHISGPELLELYPPSSVPYIDLLVPEAHH